MGRIVKLDNWTNLERAIANSNIKSFVDVSGTPRTYAFGGGNSSVYNPRAPFLVNNYTSVITSADRGYPFSYACSDATIDKSRYALTNTFGTTTIGYTQSGGGWNATIQIVHNAKAAINSLLFTRMMYYSGSDSCETLLFAYELDNPITLNADNNYTANLTMSVAFE